MSVGVWGLSFEVKGRVGVRDGFDGFWLLGEVGFFFSA